MVTLTALVFAATTFAPTAHATPADECEGATYRIRGPGKPKTECLSCFGMTKKECMADCKKVTDALGSDGWGCKYHDDLRVGPDQPVDIYDALPDEAFLLDLTCETDCVLIGVYGDLETDSPYTLIGDSAVFEAGEHSEDGFALGVVMLQAL